MSYVQRAETATSAMLAEPRFAEHVLSAAGMRAMKAARATALSIKAIDKVTQPHYIRNDSFHSPLYIKCLHYIIFMYEILMLYCH